MGNSSQICNTHNCCATGLCSPQSELSEYVIEPLKLNGAKLNSSQNKELSLIRESLISEYKENSVDSSSVPQLEKAVHYAKVLRLKVLTSSSLPVNLIIPINAQGFEDSPRNAKDGATYFGTYNKRSSPVNDVVIPHTGRTEGQHFVINYDLHTDSYFLRDLGVGFGTFGKIDKPLTVRNNQLLLMGSNFILFNLEDDLQLKIKLFGTPSVGDLYSFTPSTSRVVIGRKPKSDVHISDSLASKVQAFLLFQHSEWVLYDGDGQKPSTNGSWIYLSENYELYTGMMFKGIHTLFEVSVL